MSIQGVRAGGMVADLLRFSVPRLLGLVFLRGRLVISFEPVEEAPWART